MAANVIGLDENQEPPPRPTWPSIPSVAPPPLAAPVVTGDGAGLARLVARGSLLTIVTLGIYRFWYKTDLRRWYWRRTSLAGSALEYRGTAKELLIGFLFALAVLVPLYAVVTLGALFAGPIVGVALNVMFAVAFLLLVQYGAYRSRRYRLTRTFWRGLRFDQKGSAWRYAAMSFGWTLLTIITIGLAFPLMRRSLEGYKIRNTRFGTAEGRFEAHAADLMTTWLMVIGPLAFGIVLMAFSGLLAAGGRASAGGGMIFAAILTTFGMMSAFLLWPLYRIREFRIFADGTSIGPVSFRSAARAGALYKIYVKFILVTSVATSAIGIVAAAVVAAAGGPERAFLSPRSITVIGALGILYLGAFLALGAIKELMLNQPFWRLTAGTLTVTGLNHIDEVLNVAVQDESATGEGFADALDFGGV